MLGNPEVKRYRKNIKHEQDEQWKAWGEKMLKYINDAMEGLPVPLFPGEVTQASTTPPNDRPKDPPRFP